MLPDSHSLQQSTIRLLWGGILVASLLAFFAAWNIGSAANYGGDTGRSGVVASVDMPLHVNTEHTLSLKRLFNNCNGQPKSAESPEPVWALAAGEFIASLPFVAAHQDKRTGLSPHIRLYQLQTLNVPRAPPLV